MTNTSALPPIYAVPAVKEKVEKVRLYIAGMLRTRNLFGWKSFIEDLKVDIEVEIYKYEEKHLAGIPGYEKEQGVGAYCNMALQGAINYAAMCSTNKRRINFETQSLDALIETEKGAMSLQIPSKSSEDVAQLELLLSIQQEFGERIHGLAEKVLRGEQLDRKELSELRKSTKNPKMRNLLTEML